MVSKTHPKGPSGHEVAFSPGAAEQFLNILGRRWIGSGLPADVDWAITKLVLTAYIADRSGQPLVKGGAPAALGVEDARTARKYIALAEAQGLVVSRRSPVDARNDIIVPSDTAIRLLHQEYEGFVQGLAAREVHRHQLTSRPPVARVVFEHPSLLSQASKDASVLVEASVTNPAVRESSLAALQNGKVPLTADISWLPHRTESWLAELDERWGARQEEVNKADFAIAAFRTLFLPSLSTIKIAPAPECPDSFGLFRPDDLQAARALSTVCRALRPRHPTEIRGPLSATDFQGTLILLGGPDANVLTRLVLQFKKNNEARRSFRRVEPPTFNLRFEPVCDPRDVPENPRGRTAIWAFNDRWRNDYICPEFEDGKIKTDRLLITVLPNILDPALPENERIVIFCGLQGAGTASVELLAQDQTLMHTIREKVGTRYAWQALLKISKIDQRSDWPKPLTWTKTIFSLAMSRSIRMRCERWARG